MLLKENKCIDNDLTCEELAHIHFQDKSFQTVVDASRTLNNKLISFMAAGHNLPAFLDELLISNDKNIHIYIFSCLKFNQPHLLFDNFNVSNSRIKFLVNKYISKTYNVIKNHQGKNTNLLYLSRTQGTGKSAVVCICHYAFHCMYNQNIRVTYIEDCGK